MEHNESNEVSDKVGITSAVLCTVHCLVVPVLFLAQGWYADSMINYKLPAWWEAVDILFLVISFIAVYHSAGHTKVRQIKTALWVFWAILALSIVFSNMHWLAYIASAGLVATHFINIRRLRRLRYRRG